MQTVAPETSAAPAHAATHADTHATSIAEQWSRRFRATTFDQLPADVVTLAKRALLDYLGVAIGGASLPMAQIATSYFVELGGRPEASLLLDQRRLPAIHAALVNGVCGHTLDMDDGHRLAAGHPGVATLPAALAAAERHGASGQQLLTALVCGYEVFVRIGAHLNPAHLKRGYHTTATVAPFAAATAAGLLMGLDEQQLTRALGLAGVQGAGLMEVFHDGAMAKPFQVARGSAAGLLAADLAARAALGPRSILEGSQGFLAAMCGDADPARLVAGLQDNDPPPDWAIRGVYFKLYAACRHTHAAVDAARTLRDEHQLRPDDVQSIVVRTYSVADQLCGATALPSGPSEAKFSLPYTVALGLTVGHAGPSTFTPELVQDETLRTLASRVRVEIDPAIEREFPTKRTAALDLTTADGRLLQAEVPIARGETELPLTQADVEAKFLENARPALTDDRAAAIIAEVAALDQRGSCTRLFDLLSGR
jgi:2-methylcitrate dehydratase PrpD